jgi:sugar phosphate isomerase/epimerase
VYEPDWRTSERQVFTTQTARILCMLLPERGFGSISTVPGGFRTLARDPAAIAVIQDNLLQTAADLVALERATGRTVALALEPEPCCLIETTDETIAFFERVLLARDALLRLRKLTGLAEGEAEAALRRHVGVCYDVCHGAVEFEDPVASLRAFRRAGIATPKIQLSAAIRVQAMRAAFRSRLQRFDTGVYLHQTVVRGRGSIARYRDLSEAFAALEAGQADGEWRVHCHVPVFLTHLGEIGSTQDSLLATLRALRSEPFAPHLEVETYTWDVLPAHLKARSKADDIARELHFVLEELMHERQRDPDPSIVRHPVQAGAGL